MVSPHTHVQKGNCEVIDVLIKFIVVIISQHIHISSQINHQDVHFKYTQFNLSIYLNKAGAGWGEM